VERRSPLRSLRRRPGPVPVDSPGSPRPSSTPGRWPACPNFLYIHQEGMRRWLHAS